LILRFIAKVTGYYRAQATRLIGKYHESGQLKVEEYRRHRFPLKYSAVEVLLLARTDELQGWLSGPATRKMLQREYELYGDRDYQLVEPVTNHRTDDL